MSYGFKMSEAAIAQSIQESKLIIPRDKLGDFVGLLQLLGLWAICALTLHNSNSDWSIRVIPAFVVTGLLFIYGIYCLSKERDLTRLKTNLTAAENRKLLVSAYRILGWHIVQNEKSLVRASLPRKWYGFVSQNATALIQDEVISLNVIHEAAARGRSPFAYGMNDKKLSALISTINNLLIKEERE